MVLIWISPTVGNIEYTRHTWIDIIFYFTYCYLLPPMITLSFTYILDIVPSLADEENKTKCGFNYRAQSYMTNDFQGTVWSQMFLHVRIYYNRARLLEQLY